MRRRTKWAVGILAMTALLGLVAPQAEAEAFATSSGRTLPPLSILANNTYSGGGSLFLAPYDASGQYASGVEILDTDTGRTVWSHAVPAGQEATDFRTQTYRGQPVLTWWQGTGFGREPI